MISFFGGYCYHEQNKKEDTHLQLINIIMTNATKWSLIEGLLPFTLAIIIVALIDFYEYRCEREDKVTLEDLESRIQKLEESE